MILNKYKELFQGIGKLEGEINITLKPNSMPYVVPVHRVARSLQESLKKELNRLVQEGIIVLLGIDKPREWCNSLYASSNQMGKIRLCLNPTQLNKFIVCPHHDTKLVEDLLPKLSDAKVFSIVDACLLFFIVTLSKKSSCLTTFTTVFGRYRYVRFSSGASLSSDCFQYKMDQTFGPIKQCCGIAADLIIYGYTLEDHDRVLFIVLDTAKQVDLKFNPDKCIFRCMQIPILWNVNRC